MISTKFG